MAHLDHRRWSRPMAVPTGKSVETLYQFLEYHLYFFFINKSKCTSSGSDVTLAIIILFAHHEEKKALSIREISLNLLNLMNCVSSSMRLHAKDKTLNGIV
jgi:hypothetical protein